MNLAQRMIAQGTAALAKDSPQSEPMTFENDIEYQVNVNRTPDSQNPRGEMDMTTGEGSVIEFPKDVGYVPERGSIGVDSFGYEHSVKTVKHLRHAIRLTCEVTR